MSRHGSPLDHGSASPNWIARAVGFGNVLVHDYVQVDDDIVTARLADLSDLRDYVRAVAGLLGGA